MEKKLAALIINDYSSNGLSYRSIGKKYGISVSRGYRMINSKKEKLKQEKGLQAQAIVLATEEATILSAMPDDIKSLKEELRKARIENELLNLVIDISGRELGVDLRKKSGTRLS